MDRHHVRLVECSGGSRFSPEAFLKHRIVGQLRGQDFQRDYPFGDCVEGAPNLSHAPATEQLEQAVATERRTLRVSIHWSAPQVG